MKRYHVWNGSTTPLRYSVHLHPIKDLMSLPKKECATYLPWHCISSHITQRTGHQQMPQPSVPRLRSCQNIQWPKTCWNRILMNALYVRVFNNDFSCRSTNENKCFKMNSTRTWSNTLDHARVFLRFHENATNRDSIRLNTNKFDNMGLFSPKHITHGYDVAGPT